MLLLFQGNINNVNALYYIGYFNGNEFPLSIDHCNPRDVLGQTGFQMATCLDSDNVLVTYYSDSDCSVMTDNETVTSSDADEEGYIDDFNCDSSSTDSYAEVEFAAFTCTTNTKVVMHAAIGVCAYVGVDGDNGPISIRVYCEPDYAELTYSNSTDCDINGIYKMGNASDTCDFMIKTDGVKVYGQVCRMLYSVHLHLQWPQINRNQKQNKNT